MMAGFHGGSHGDEIVGKVFRNIVPKTLVKLSGGGVPRAGLARELAEARGFFRRRIVSGWTGAGLELELYFRGRRRSREDAGSLSRRGGESQDAQVIPSRPRPCQRGVSCALLGDWKGEKCVCLAGLYEKTG